MAIQLCNMLEKRLTNYILKNIFVLTMVKCCLFIIMGNTTGLQIREKSLL